jgi:hypothetical protein
MPIRAEYVDGKGSHSAFSRSRLRRGALILRCIGSESINSPLDPRPTGCM